MGKNIRTNRVISYKILYDNIEEIENSIARVAFFNRDNNNKFNLNHLFHRDNKTFIKSLCEFQYLELNEIISFTNGYDCEIDSEFIENLLEKDFIGIDEVIYE